ncbi:MAG: metallopeptidase TldD-related protein, partial [Terriglobales bacterium]
LELLAAKNCPSGLLDVILMPDQMMLQIHESIGHLLELDRILGDERNFAGTSFVSLDMFGTYRYGSELLNVTYDPTRAEQFASYGWDDDGLAAEKQFVIRAGMLERPLATPSKARSSECRSKGRACRPWSRSPRTRAKVWPALSSAKGSCGRRACRWWPRVRSACRLTGMTRFASFWVENGAIKAPLNVMRFDDTAYRVLRDNLEALTRERDLVVDDNSYGERSTSSMRTPGALVREFALTL